MPPMRQGSPKRTRDVTMNGTTRCGFKENGTQVKVLEIGTSRYQSDSANGAVSVDVKQSNEPSAFGTRIRSLRLDAQPFTTTTPRIRITDTCSQRWEIPSSVVPVGSGKPTSSPYYSIGHDDGKNGLGLSITRKGDIHPIFDTRESDFSFCEQYIEFSTQLPSDTHVFGLGEVTGDFKREPGLRYAFWARDAQTPIGENAYSSVPFFMGISEGKAFGVYLHNSNAMDMIYTTTHMKYKIVGGIIDLFVFIGPRYEDVICQFQEVVGRPQLPPYWSFGYHQCRWGYDSLQKLEDSRKKHAELELPVDTWWLDIDYMEAYRLFTLDEERYPNFASYVENKMHKANQRLVAVIDPGIKTNLPDYKPWTTGLDSDLFVKNGNTNRDFVGKVWPGHVSFPDWFHPKTQEYWTRHHKEFFKKMPMDGIWHDMNECSNFLNGDAFEQDDPTALEDCILIPTDEETVELMADWSAEGDNPEAGKRGPGKEKPKAAFDPTQPFSITNPPYAVNHGGSDWPLSARSISVESLHHGGITEYNAHNLFGLQNCKATYNTLLELKPDERPFILTRSIFPSAGRWCSKWLGDNWSTWESMRYSVAGMFNMQMFGMPHVGADIGGFNGIPSQELLIRWFQLGSMYPFCRNHNLPNTPNQEAYISDIIANNARKYLSIRYRLLPFWYTAFDSVSSVGGSVVQPVWSIYPPQSKSTMVISKVMSQGNVSFLINKTLLVAPVVEEGATQVTTWLPRGSWYDLHSGARHGDSIDDKWVTLEAPLDHMPILLRSGSVIPLHYAQAGSTSIDFRRSGLTLCIVLDESTRTAEGEVYLDDGHTFSSAKSRISIRASCDTTGRLSVKMSGTFTYQNKEEARIRSLVVYGSTQSVIIMKELDSDLDLTEDGVQEIEVAL